MKDIIIDIVERNITMFVPREKVEQIADDILENLSFETLRDKFAGQALAGAEIAMWKMSGPGGLAENCYRMADAMIAERERT